MFTTIKFVIHSVYYMIYGMNLINLFTHTLIKILLLILNFICNFVVKFVTKNIIERIFILKF